MHHSLLCHQHLGLRAPFSWWTGFLEAVLMTYCY